MAEVNNTRPITLKIYEVENCGIPARHFKVIPQTLPRLVRRVWIPDSIFTKLIIYIHSTNCYTAFTTNYWLLGCLISIVTLLLSLYGIMPQCDLFLPLKWDLEVVFTMLVSLVSRRVEDKMSLRTR